MSPYRTPAAMPVEPPLPTSRMGVLTPLAGLSGISLGSAVQLAINVPLHGVCESLVYACVTFVLVTAWAWRSGWK